MDWTKPTEALMPGLEGVVLSQLHAVAPPQTASDVHRRVRVGSRNGVRYALDRLAEQGVVLRTVVGNAAIYELNRDHLAYPALDAALSTYRPYAELRERLRDLARGVRWVGHDDVFSLAVYGSVARREAGTGSDVDLLLVIPDGCALDDPDVDDLSEALHVQVQRWTGNRVHVDVRTRADVRTAAETGDPLFSSWVRDADFVFGDDIVARTKAAVA